MCNVIQNFGLDILFNEINSSKEVIIIKKTLGFRVYHIYVVTLKTNENQHSLFYIYN